MYAIRARRKTVTEKDFLDAVNKASPMLSIMLYVTLAADPLWGGHREQISDCHSVWVGP